MLPNRVLHRKGSVFYGYGSDSQNIEEMSSVHKKGTEPGDCIWAFGHHWTLERGSYTWDGVVHLNWKKM